jgi:hypothetical protein
MRKIAVIIIMLALTSSSFGQKLYVWCPKEQLAAPRQGFLQNDTIDLVIFDGRILTEKSKVECTSNNTIIELQKMLKQTYPSALINMLSANDYYKDPKPNRITLKIGISAYHAAFGADIKVGIGSVGGNFSYGAIPEGKWNGITAYSVKIYDYRNNHEIKKTKDISKISSKPNMWGYKTAKDCLNISYMEANQEMLFFIDETFMK